MSSDILVIDDEADIRELVTDILKEEGFAARSAANSTQALKAINEKVPSAIILDIWLQGSELDGLGILELVKGRYPIMPVIIISGHGTIETAVSAIKIGAYDYLEKPFSHEKLLIVLRRACENARLKKENIELKSKVVDKVELIGLSTSTVKLKSDIEKVAPTSGRVTIQGGMGVGKELVARLIHKKSKRGNGPFVIFNPTCFAADRMYQELFGYSLCEINNSNHLSNRKISLLEAANNGTLYIDEVSVLSMNVQTRLLKFLQEQTLEKPGISKPIKLDVRFITSATKNLLHEVNSGRFRQDLYYRLNVVPLRVPSLSERKEDIPLLVQYFIKQLAKLSGLKERKFSEDSIASLQAYNWIGNVRQLRNVIEWTLIMNPSYCEDDLIRPDMLPPDILNHGVTIAKPENNIDMMSMPLREAREVFERQYLAAQMNRFNNNISKTSSFVGMERSALHRKLKLLSIHIAGNKIHDEEMQEEHINA